MNSVLPDWAHNVSRETIPQLHNYVGLLLKWNPKINLIGKTTEQEIWSRHIVDSWQLLDLIPAYVKTQADLGSGAGLPGIIIAIARPDLDVTLVEQDQRKAAFLTEAVRALNLKNVKISAVKIESVTDRYDLITARALAPLVELCKMALPLMGTKAICLFPKGENFAMELEEARQKFTLKTRLVPSKTSEKSYIISVSELSRKDHE